VDVDLKVFLEYNRELDVALAQSIWSHTGMTTYYRNEAGRIVVSSPWKYVDYWELLNVFDDREYHSEAVAAESAAAV
jgi:4-hydroxyacetophenone monooxygenase